MFKKIPATVKQTKKKTQRIRIPVRDKKWTFRLDWVGHRIRENNYKKNYIEINNRTLNFRFAPLVRVPNEICKQKHGHSIRNAGE